MALKTKIRETHHYVSRITVSERLGNKDIRYANKTFDHIMKRVRRGQIKPFPGKKEGTFGVHFR